MGDLSTAFKYLKCSYREGGAPCFTRMHRTRGCRHREKFCLDTWNNFSWWEQLNIWISYSEKLVGYLSLEILVLGLPGPQITWSKTLLSINNQTSCSPGVPAVLGCSVIPGLKVKLWHRRGGLKNPLGPLIYQGRYQIIGINEFLKCSETFPVWITQTLPEAQVLEKNDAMFIGSTV